MPDFGTPFSGLALDRKVTDAELVRAIRFMVAAEYEAVQFRCTCSLLNQRITNWLLKCSRILRMRNVCMPVNF